MLGLTCHLRELKSVDIVLGFFFFFRHARFRTTKLYQKYANRISSRSKGENQGKKAIRVEKIYEKNIKKTKQKERKRKTSSSKNQTQYILCIGAILYVELRQARAVPKTFSCLDKTAGYFFIVKTTQRKLHSGTGKNYHLTPRQLSRNKPVQCVFISSTRYLIASL